MKWNKFRLKTTTEAEDIVSSMLADLGVEGVQIEDKIPLTAADKEQMFVDILPETEADVEEFSKEITDGLSIIPVKTMKEVLHEAFLDDLPFEERKV